MEMLLPSAPAYSFDGFFPRESFDLQSCLRAAEAFTQGNSPSRSSSVSSRAALLLPIDLGKSDMVLTAMRISSTERFILDNEILGANSCKVFVDKLDTLGGVNMASFLPLELLEGNLPNLILNSISFLPRV